MHQPTAGCGESKKNILVWCEFATKSFNDIAPMQGEGLFIRLTISYASGSGGPMAWTGSTDMVHQQAVHLYNPKGSS